MAKRNKIRITKNDRTEYNRLRRNALSKINRTEKKFGVDLRDRIELPKLSDFTTRNEFNKWKHQIESFTNRANLEYQFEINKYGVVASKKEIAQIKRDNKKAIRNAKKMIDSVMKQPFMQGGEKYGKVADRVSQMSKEEIAGVSVPVEFDFNKVNSRERLEDVKHNNETRATGEHYKNKNDNLKNNFILMMQRAFNSEADEIVERLKNIPADDFVEMSIMFDEMDIRTYDSEDRAGINDVERMHQIESYLDMYDNNEIDFRLKKF